MLYNHGHNLSIRSFQDKLFVSNGKTLTVVASGEKVMTGFVAARTEPYVFFNVMTKNDVGYDWARVARCDLTSGTTISVLTPEDVKHLKLLIGGAGAFVGDVLAVTDDAKTLTVVMALPEQIDDENGVPQGMKMNYGVYDLDVATKKYVKLKDLDTAFG